MNSVKASQAFRDIFPNGNYAQFLHYFSYWHDVDLALWAYGEIRQHEYLMEKATLKNELQQVKR